MFTRSDLDTLMADGSPHAVSLYLPTHVLGAETREGPIRLKNLLAAARSQLLDQRGGEESGERLGAGLDAAAADALLSPAMTLVEDYRFWQHQDQGLAMFLGEGEPRTYQVPLALHEQVIVGHGFHVMPLLPLLASDGHFFVCALTQDQVRLFQASRFAMTEVTLPDLPAGAHADTTTVSDYENPVQASPVARPHTASIDISNAQVYGDSPPEWRKGRVVEYVRKAAAAIDQLIRAQPAPVVLIANAELAGHFRKSSQLGRLLVAAIDSNPAAADQEHLHALAYTAARPGLDLTRSHAVSRFATLHGRKDPRAVTDTQTIITMSGHGRIETLLLTDSAPTSTGDEHALDAAATVLEAVVTQTLQQGGDVHLVPASDLPGVTAAATLRY